MSNRLDPLIQKKLRAFARRRRRLIMVRGIFAALAMLLLTMLLVAAVDFFFVLPDWGRWALSGTAYLAVLIIAWRQCLSWLLHAPNERQLARLIEHAEPRLREDLLSAVELGRTQGEIMDSEQFRALVQEDVAHRMEKVEMKNLLPVALIRRFIGYAFCVAIVVVAMGLATGWQFSTLFLRALMPGANLDRVSRTKVMITLPLNGDKLVAHGDTERVEIELGGERASKAFIELFSEKEGWQALEMKPEGKDRFSATVNIGRESLHYRIKAGDALTRKYFLDARERPYITQFEKSFNYPKYAQLQNRVVNEPQGDLIALEGTQVELKMSANQRILSGELAVELGKSSQTIPLKIEADGRLSAQLPLNASGSYRVKLVSAETNFANKILPENELRAEPDQKPSVELITPKADLILANNELVDLAGQATDDYGLAKIVHRVRVNDGPWHDTMINAEPPQKTPFDYRWDLYPLNLKAGDLVTSKVVAVDRKGYEGESRVLQITIAAAGYELRRLQTLESLRVLNTAAGALSDQSKTLGDVTKTARDSFVGSEQAELRRTTLVSANSALTAWQAKYDECWTALGAVLRESAAGHASAELVILGRELSRMQATTIGTMQTNLTLLQANPTVGGAKELMQEIAQGGQQTFHRTLNVKNALESFTIAEEASALAENGQVVMREQQHLLDLADQSGDNPQKWQPLISRFRVALTQVKSLENLLAPMAERSGAAKVRAQQAISMLGKRRERMENALTGGTPNGRLLRDPLRELNDALKSASRGFVDWHREAGPNAAKASENIIREGGLSYGHIARLQQDLGVLRSNKQLAPELQTPLQASRWEARANAFKGHGDVEELRPTADNPFVGDLRMTTSALQALHAVTAGTEPAKIEEKLVSLDGALRVLENAHNLREVLDGLSFFAGNERWDLRSLSARTQPPRDWKWLESRLRTIPEELRKARDLADKQASVERDQPLVQFVSADPNPKKPDDYVVTLQLGVGKHAKKQTVPVGEPVPGTTYRVTKFDPHVHQQPDGAAVETSEVTLTEERSARTFKLEPGHKSSDKPTGEQFLAAFDGAREILEKAQQLPAWRNLEGEMDQRATPERTPVSAKGDAELLAGQVKLALELFRPLIASAREELKIIAPKISELAAALAKEQDALKKETAEDAKKDEAKPDAPKTEEAQRENEHRVAAQQAINEKVESLKDLIRAEANQQNILKADEREAMRDADDAVAMLKEPPPKAEQALQDAAKDAPAQQKADLERATEQQEKLKDALEKIAGHFEAVEQGKSIAETRAALREEEKALGLKEEFDQQLAHAQMLAELAQKDAAQLLKELEAKLPDNPLMQKELSDLSKDALAAAEQNLKKATDTEKSIAQALENQTQQTAAKNKEAQFQAQKQARQEAAKTAAQAAKQALQAARDAQKSADTAEHKAKEAQNQNAERQADNAGHKANDAVKEAEKAVQAAEQMAQANNAQEAQQKAERVMEKAGKAAQAAEQAEQSAKEAQASADQAAKQGGDKQAANEQSAQQAGEAAKQAEQAAQAAKEAKALAQQANEQAKAMAQNPPAPQPGESPQATAQKSAQTAADAAKQAAAAAQQAQQSAEAAEAQAKGAQNAQAEQQADQAGKQAAKAAEAAQAAAQNAEKMAATGTPQQAAQAAQQAAQKAGEAAQAADQAANAAQQAQASADQAGKNPGEQQQANQAAAQKSGEANQQAKAAAQAARQAQTAAQAAAQQAQALAQENQNLANAARQQPAIAGNTQEAGGEIARAARHEMRLGNQAEALAALGKDVQETAQSDVPAAAAALNKAQMAAQAQAPVNQAAQELGQELASLQKAQQGNPDAGQPQAGQPQAGQPQAGQPQAGQPQAGQPQAGQPQAGQPQAGQPQAGQPQAGQPAAGTPAQAATPAEQQAFARALDALDQQLNAPPAESAGQPGAPPEGQPGQPGEQAAQPGAEPGQPGQPGAQPGQPGQGEGPSAAAQAMAAAAQAAQASMRQARAQLGKSGPSQGAEVATGESAKSEGGAAAQGSQLDGNLQATAKHLKPGEWGKLPKKLADQLTKGQQEAVAGDYRQAVETYYRVIAEKAKQQK